MRIVPLNPLYIPYVLLSIILIDQVNRRKVVHINEIQS